MRKSGVDVTLTEAKLEENEHWLRAAPTQQVLLDASG